MSLSKPSYDFPEEILSEIFKRLPIKYLLRCRCVQKSWYYLIKTPMFKTLHYNHHKLSAHDNPKHLLFYEKLPIYYLAKFKKTTHLLTVRSDDEQCQEYGTLEYPPDLRNHIWSALSYGLICVSNGEVIYNPIIYIWNPLGNKFKTLPDSPLPVVTDMETDGETDWKALAFGFLPEVDDYVVVHIGKYHWPWEPSHDFESHEFVIGVYSLNTNSWKLSRKYTEYGVLPWIYTETSVFVNSTAFWVGYDNWDSRQLVIYFDTKTEIVGEISVPEWNGLRERQFDTPLIHPFGQSIAYFVENDESRHLDIWVLKDEMIDESSWEKKMSVSLSENVWEKKMSVSLSENVWADVLGIRNNDEPILAKSNNNLISYNLDTHEPYDFVDSCDRLTPYSNYEEGSIPPFAIRPFVETLFLLDID